MTLPFVETAVGPGAIATAEALSVANIDSPTELGSIAGTVVGEKRLCYQTVAAANEWTLYAWDSASSTGASSPYRVDGSSGQWIAVAGKYDSGARNFNSTLAVIGAATLSDALTVAGGTTNGGVYVATTGPLTTTLASIGNTSTAPAWITGTGNTVLRINATTSSGATATNRGINVKPTLVAGAYTCGLVSKAFLDLATANAGVTVTRTQGITVRADTTGATGNAGFVFGAQEAVTFTGNWCFYSDQATSSFHGGPWTMGDTTDSSSTTTGSLTVSGGIGLAKKLTFGGTLTAAINSGSTINGDFSDTAVSRTVAVVRVNSSATAHTSAALLDVISGASTVSDIMFRLRASSVDLMKAYASGAVSINVGPLIVGAASVAAGTASLYIKQTSNSATAYGIRFVHASSDTDYFQAAYDTASALGLGSNSLAVYSTQISAYAFAIERTGRVGSFSSLVCGTNSALATNATDGFLYLPSSAGSPSGTPTAITGKVPFQYDTTNNRLYSYNGAWVATPTNYVEGTFTPVIAGSTTAGTQTYSVQVGRYTRIGNTVHFRLTVAISALDGAAAGGCRITGLPFAANSTSNNRNSAAIGLMANVTQTAAKIAFTAHIDASATEVRMRETASAAGTADLPVTNLGATAQFSIAGSYEV